MDALVTGGTGFVGANVVRFAVAHMAPGQAGPERAQLAMALADGRRVRADTAAMIVAYGFTYDQGDGIHDIHMNSGEPAGSSHANQVNKDGALVFYYRDERQDVLRRWVFIKFSTQSL